MFYEVNDDYPFLLALEDRWEIIWSEVQGLGPLLYSEYEHSKDGGWKIMLFVMLDKYNEQYEEQCPLTFELLRNIPNLTFAAISKLSRFSSIHAHREWIKEDDKLLYNNGNMHRAHLGLQVPIDASACSIRVGDEVRSWTPGKVIMFNDTVEHEVWNSTCEDRIVLVLDFIKLGCTILENEQIQLLKKQMIDLHMKY